MKALPNSEQLAQMLERHPLILEHRQAVLDATLRREPFYLRNRIRILVACAGKGRTDKCWMTP